WYSTNVSGEAFSHYVPDYILNREGLRLSRNQDGEEVPCRGVRYALLLDNEWLLKRETKAVTTLFNHIRYWDYFNGNKSPIISAQVHVEPDAFVRKLDEREYKYTDGSKLSKDKAWEMTRKSLDAV